MSDLKLIDELLLDYMRSNRLQPADLLHFSNLTREVITRLRTAWESGEMPEITLTWANFFRETSAAATQNRTRTQSPAIARQVM